MASITLLREWANLGTKVKPSDAQIDLGWVDDQQPPYEWENERMASRDAKINEIATYLNTGVPVSDLVADDSLELDTADHFQVGVRSSSTRSARMTDDSYEIINVPGTTYQLGSLLTPWGLTMLNGTGIGGGPGERGVYFRVSEFSFVPSSVSTSSRIIDFSLATPLTLTGIPDTTLIKSISLEFSTDSAGYDRHSLPLSCTFAPEDSGTYSDVTITNASALSTTSLFTLSTIYNGWVIVAYDALNVN